MSFNLVHEPWIPVLRADGAPDVLSLRGCFEQASDVRRVVGDLPTQSFAILRVMLAVCHDAIGFHRARDIERLLNEGLDVTPVLSYLDAHADRFDLFHAQRPFMQVATLRTAKNDVAGLEKLISDVPNGHPFLTTRGGSGLRSISAAEAARWLIHAHAFDPSGIRSAAVGDPETKGGKGYPIGPAWAGQIGGIVLHGKNLAETLAYNITATPDSAADRPVWAADQAQTEQRQIEPAPAGPVQLLAWQSRRIRLVGDADGVTGVILCQGDRMTPQNRHDLEPMTAWRHSIPQSKKLGITVYMPQKHDPTRDGWRGFPALVSTNPGDVEGQAKSRRPATVASMADHAEADINKVIGLEMVGMDYGPQEATVAELYYDRLDFRVSLLGEQALGIRTTVDDAISLADTCVREIGKMAANIARAAGDRDGTDGAYANALTETWAALELPARTWLSDLSPATNRIEAMRDFQKRLRIVAEASIDHIARTASPAATFGRQTSYGFMTSAKAELFARKKLRDELPLAYPTEEEKADD